MMYKYKFTCNIQYVTYSTVDFQNKTPFVILAETALTKIRPLLKFVRKFSSKNDIFFGRFVFVWDENSIYVSLCPSNSKMIH
jgi:hypothetical protein